jgi:DHA1 family multidrug resistance protein-like MFS transporter
MARVEPWRRNQQVMVAAVFVVYTGFAFVLPFLPLYVRDLGVVRADQAALWAGVLIGVSPLLAGLLSPFWGRLADRHGQKRMVLLALGAYVALLLLSAAVRNVLELLALRIGVGLFGAIGPLALSMATALAPREETGRAVGLVQAAQILAAAVGPLAGGLLADAVGIPGAFVATAALCAVALFLVAALYEEAPRLAAPEAAPGRLADVLRLPEVGSLLVVLFLVNFIGRSFTPILPLHLSMLGVPQGRVASATGLLIAVYSVAAAVSATTLGRASRTRSPRGLLAAGLLGGAATVLPMALVPSYPGFVGLAVLLGLASGGCLTLCYTMGGLRVPEGQRATSFGFFSGAALFGGAVSPTVAGLLARLDLRAIYYVDAALFLLLAGSLARDPAASAPAVADRAGLR